MIQVEHNQNSFFYIYENVEEQILLIKIVSNETHKMSFTIHN